MAYQDLGARPTPPALGMQDGTLGQAPFNPYLPGTGWVVVIDANLIGTYLTRAEVYHIFLDGPVGSSARLFRNGHPWDGINQAWANGWDPSQPMPLAQTDTIGIAWNVPFTAGPYNLTSNVQPTVTLWIRSLLEVP